MRMRWRPLLCFRILVFGFLLAFVIRHSSFISWRLILKATDAGNSVMGNPKSVVSGQWLVLVAAFLGWMFDGLEMGIFPLVARPALQDMMHGAGGGDEFVARWMGRITALFLVGAACGGVNFGWLGAGVERVRSNGVS